MGASYLVILLLISCPVNSNGDYGRDSAINYVMIEEALQRRIDAIKEKIDVEKRERERRIQENNEKFDELQRRFAVEDMVEIKDADQDTRIKRGREDNEVIQESKKVEDEAAGKQPNFLFQSEAQPGDNRRIIRRRHVARRFRGSPLRFVRRRRRRHSRSPRRRRRRRRRRNKSLTSAYAENFARTDYKNGPLSRFKRV
ncbi:uncharacterized protein LOC100678071 isoform X1 [Nasonia vitripennis]|uniref:Uncharacterized protein n=1 Tax=Nasonia vitripennis TaxID=7425 RepID=A0A7M7GL27_NASVI|nr:uncharacterized protein LOC100678071 isoform X1 [Nasonia vitripennis]